MLELALLPEVQTMVRAYVPDEGGMLFGTLATISRSMAEEKKFLVGTDGQIDWPEVVNLRESFLRTNYSNLPQGWIVKTCWRSDCYGVALFVGYVFETPLRFVWPEGVPPEVGLVLSGMMQLGEKPTFKNFRRYLHRAELKFMPFTISPQGYRFCVYNPTPERIERAGWTFADVRNRLHSRGLESRLAAILRVAYALIRLDEISGQFKFKKAEREADVMQGALSQMICLNEVPLHELSRCLAFVYRDLCGPKSVIPFDLERYGRDAR